MVRRVVGRFPDSSTAASQHMPVLTATRLCKAHLGATSLATRRRSKCCLHHVPRRSLRVRYNGCNTASTRAAALSEPALCSTIQTLTDHKSSNDSTGFAHRRGLDIVYTNRGRSVCVQPVNASHRPGRRRIRESWDEEAVAAHGGEVMP